MSKIKVLRKKWLYGAIGGILLMGFGLSLLGNSIMMKYENDILFEWFIVGTVALSLFFAGLSVFGNAVINKSQIDFHKLKSEKKRKKR